MMQLTPKDLQIISRIAQYLIYLEGRCVVMNCLNAPKLYYQVWPNQGLTAWSLCKKCKKTKERFQMIFKEYSAKELFTIKLYAQ